MWTCLCTKRLQGLSVTCKVTAGWYITCFPEGRTTALQTSGRLRDIALRRNVQLSVRCMLAARHTTDYPQDGHTLSHNLRPYSGSSRSKVKCCRERSRRPSYSRQTRECSSSIQWSTGRPVWVLAPCKHPAICTQPSACAFQCNKLLYCLGLLIVVANLSSPGLSVLGVSFTGEAGRCCSMVSTRSGGVVAVGAQSAEVSSRRDGAAKAVPRTRAQGEPVHACHCSVSHACLSHLCTPLGATVGSAVRACVLDLHTAPDLCPLTWLAADVRPCLQLGEPSRAATCARSAQTLRKRQCYLAVTSMHLKQRWPA